MSCAIISSSCVGITSIFILESLVDIITSSDFLLFCASSRYIQRYHNFSTIFCLTIGDFSPTHAVSIIISTHHISAI